MSWVRYDDDFHDHPKVAELVFTCPEALALHLLANTWTARNGRGGFVPAAIPRRLMGSDQTHAAAALVEAGLWKVVEGGWVFHDWNDYNSVSEARKRAQSANARRRWEKVEGDPPEPPESVKAQVADANGISLACQDVPSECQDVPSECQKMPARARPVPVPIPIPKEQLHATATQSRTPSTQTIIDEWISHCPERPPGRVVGQVAREVKIMLAEGIPYDRVRAGVAEWARRGLHPATIASVVHELAIPGGRHSRSDGSLSPAELFAQAAAAGVSLGDPRVS